MKNKLLKIVLANVVMLYLLFSLSCSTASPNKLPSPDSANNAVAQTADDAKMTAPTTADCDGDPSIKQKKIKDGIKNSIDKHDGLKNQYDKNKFDFEPVVDTNGNAVLYIWGQVFTSAKDLNQLNNAYEGFVKKGCVTKVVFNSVPGTKALSPGFEYNLCEYPNQVCSDGTCQPTCPKPAIPNANSNTKP